MGKNHIENSLKRFLKRKVKITLGLIVAFMITGTVGFAEETENWEYFLLNKTLGNHFCDGICPEGIEFNPEDETLEVTKDNKLIINGKEYHNHGDIVIPTGTGWRNIEIDGANPIFCNYGDITLSGSYAINVKNTIKTDANIFNYGNIFFNDNSDYFLSSDSLDKTTNLHNYGNIVMKSEKPRGLVKGQIKIYTYGSMVVTSSDLNSYESNFTFNKENKYEIHNYGYVDVDKIRVQLAEEEKLFNNGVITTRTVANTGMGSTPATENIINNKGIFIIENDIDSTTWKAFTNKGAILKKEGENYKLLNSDTLESNEKNDVIIAHGVVKDMSNETVMNKDTIKTNGKEVDNLFINNKSLKLDLGEKLPSGQGQKITGKTITAISQTAGNVVLDNSKDNGISGNEHLTLDNTTIVGYFEKEGTLLKVDGDLRLENNSIITAVAKRDENGDFLVDSEKVVAVEVNGNLSFTEGESHIFGEIKGGKNSVINVDGNNNPEEINVLSEQISTSGTVNLNDGDWTKGEFGNITLNGDTSIVNVYGNLVGDLMGDSSNTETTLDGMIDGQGTLNVDKIVFNLGNISISSLDDEFILKWDNDVILGDITKVNPLDKIKVSEIFKKEVTPEGNLKLTFKTAKEMGITDPEKQKEYEELIKNYQDHYETINGGTAKEILALIGVINKVMEIMGTAGVKITRDIAGAFTDSINEFDKKANKGEWLTNAKYIGSDMEYDGTSTVNGYESDINSMVAMAEYGISDNTSLGFALGGGDTEIDLKELNGKSTSLDGNNYYAGIYAKHSVNGFDMTGSFGYTISDLDVKDGGSADSEAFTLAGYIKRDINLTDTVKLQPNLAFAYDYIMQDTAEMGKGMSVNSGDYHVFEADIEMNIVKEFAFNNGNLELKVGIKYSMTNVERNKEITGKYYEADVNLGSPEIDDTKGTAHIGFDYEHTTGFGVNGKYETMWSDSGDDSRITAGVSYRF